jgi:DNA adenine methylase
MLRFLTPFLPAREQIRGRYIEPFVGGAAVFLHLQPHTAILSDSNEDLIDLYRGIRADPEAVWHTYASFGSTKEEYQRVRSLDPSQLDLVPRAARLLYLNRTCFKGNWRHNSKGQFNVGYGGQSRRWVITEDYLLAVSAALRRAQIRCSDFQPVIESSSAGDHLFVDPPYRPAQRELVNDHYTSRRFTHDDHRRLAVALKSAAARGVTWCMTTSAHQHILALFEGFHTRPIPARRHPEDSGEVLVLSGQRGTQ